MWLAKRFPVLALIGLLGIFAQACGGGGGGGGGPTGPSTTGDLTGSWRGSWSSSSGRGGGSVSATINQSGSSITGSVTVTGSSCFTTGSASGTVSDSTVIIGVAFPGAQQVTFRGTISSDGSSMSGSYSVSGGACSGDSGTWGLTRT